MKKRNKKGFTLIELLAVIVILAIVALIAVPIVMNLINKARKSAAEDSTYGIISASKNYYAESLLKNNKIDDIEIIFGSANANAEKGVYVSSPSGIDLESFKFNGTIPSSGKIKIGKDGKIEILESLRINGDKCNYSKKNEDKIECNKSIGYKPGSTIKVNTLYDVQANEYASNGVYKLVFENNTTIDAEIYIFESDVVLYENPILCDDVLDSKMCIVIYEGDLTIDDGVVLTPQVRKKGFMVYVKGTLNNNGIISMTGKGAASEGQDVLLFKNGEDDYEYVPKDGGVGGASVVATKDGRATNGSIGKVGTRRSTAGGGSGGTAARNNYYYSPYTTYGSTGGQGTSFAGGGGSGGTSRHSQTDKMVLKQPNLYIGGNGSLADGSYYSYKSCSGGGAGIEGGIGIKSSGAQSTENGQTGAGGLLVIYVNNLVLNSTGQFVSEGSNGGGCVAGGGSGNNGSAASGGGGSGGGSINIFAKKITNNEVSDLTTIYSTKGGLGGIGSGGSANARGGAGGTGSFTIGIISNEGVYTDYSL